MASVLVNTALSVVGRGGGLVFGLVITALLSRALGVSQFGEYALVLSFGAMLHIATDWGLYLTLTREIARRPRTQNHLLATITSLRLVIFITVFILGGLLIAAIPSYRHLLVVFIVAVIGFLFQSLSQLLMGVFQAHGTVWKALLGDLSGRVAQLVVVAIFVAGMAGAANSGVLFACFAFSVGAALAYLVHSVTVPATPWKLTFETSSWRAVMADAWPIGVMLILNAIYFRIDIVMLSWFRDTLEVGWYGLAYRIVESGLFLPAAFGGLLLPKLSAAKAYRRIKLVNQGLFAMLVIGALVFVVLAGAADEIVTLFAGQDFLPSGSLLAILVAALVTMFFGNVFGFTLVAIGQQRALLYLYAVLALGNAVANLFVIPRFGAVGAAWTTVATEGFAAIIAARILYRHLPYKISWQGITRVLAAGIAAASVLSYLLPITSAIPAIVCAAVVFIGIAAALGLLRRSHVELLLEP